MPSWRIHSAIGSEMLKHIHISDINKFMFGNILPDVLNGHLVRDISQRVRYRDTHYANIIDEGMPQFPDSKKFLDKYIDNVDDTVIGYYIHLETDYIWNNYASHRILELNSDAEHIIQSVQSINIQVQYGDDIIGQGDQRPEQPTLNRLKQFDFHTFSLELQPSYTTLQYNEELYNSAAKLLPLTRDDCYNSIEVYTEKVTENSVGNTTSVYYIFSKDELMFLFEKTILMLLNDDFLKQYLK